MRNKAITIAQLRKKLKALSAESPDVTEQSHKSNEKDFYGSSPLDPLGPTNYPPGSDGKIQVMQDRVARRMNPFHPDDYNDLR